MPGATVKEFDPTKGFGTLTLDTGEDLSFDIAVANTRDPKPGDRVEVTLGVGWKGRPKATLVIFQRNEQKGPPFGQAIEQLRAFGFLRDWDVEQARTTAKQMWDDGIPAHVTRGDAAALLHRYYGERGRAEGVVTIDRRFQIVTPAWLAEVGALCDVRVEAASLPQALVEINAALVARGDAHRLFSLDVGIDFHVVAYRTLDFEARIATTTWLGLSPA